jgi:hypothetical protein
MRPTGRSPSDGKQSQASELMRAIEDRWQFGFTLSLAVPGAIRALAISVVLRVSPTSAPETRAR